MKLHIDENADLKQLATMVFLRAVEETTDPDPLIALDACYWMTTRDAVIWLDVAGLEKSPAVLLRNGRARGRVKTKGIAKRRPAYG